MWKLTNPVLMKELTLRFRFVKTVNGLIAYLAAMGIFVLGFFIIAGEISGITYFRPSESFYLFLMLAVIQMGMVLFITPGLTASAISSEREKQTLNMLLTTTQSSFSIIFGKLLSSIAFLGLLLIAGLPLYSIVFLFGGVSPVQLLMVFGFSFLTMLSIGSIGIFFSTVTKKTITATITTYSTSVFFGGFTLFFFFVSLIVTGTFAMDTTMSPIAYLWVAINPGALILSVLSPDVAVGIAESTGMTLPIWIPYLIFYSVLAVTMLFFATKKLRSE